MTYLDDIKTRLSKIGNNKDCAAVLGISEGYLGDILNGKRTLSIKMACLLEKHFGMSAERLLQARIKEDLRAYQLQHNKE